MHRLIVTLPENRDYAGMLWLEGADGDVIAGPFAVCGRADQKAAQHHANPNRDPLLPFGDTPLGRYRVAGIQSSGAGTARPADHFGPYGVIVLTPTGGDAALADANGRFHVLIQGGAPAHERRLRPTNGSLRLGNRDQRILMGMLGEWRDTPCELRPMPGTPVTKRVATESPCGDGDPPDLITCPAVVNGVATASMSLGMSGSGSRFAPPAANFLPEGAGGGDSGSDYKGDEATEKEEKQEEKESTVRGLMHRAFTSGASAAQKAIREAPAKIASSAVDHGIAALNSQLQKEGQQAMSSEQAGGLRDAINSRLAPDLNRIGKDLADKLRSAIGDLPPEQAGASYPANRPTPKVTPEFTTTFGAGRLTLNSRGQVGNPYTAQDFLDFMSRPGLQTALGPLTTNLNKLSVDVAAKSANWSADIATHFTIANPAGTLQFDRVMLNFKYKF